MSNMNVVCLSGNLTKTPELLEDKKGVAYVTTDIATHENYRTKNGEWKRFTFFNTLMARGSHMQRLLDRSKGQRVSVRGVLDYGRVRVQDLTYDPVRKAAPAPPVEAPKAVEAELFIPEDMEPADWAS